jgi:hypothetical protein
LARGLAQSGPRRGPGQTPRETFAALLVCFGAGAALLSRFVKLLICFLSGRSAAFIICEVVNLLLVRAERGFHHL